jgi:hypothetical protein
MIAPARTYNLQGLATTLTVMLVIDALAALTSLLTSATQLLAALLTVPIMIVFLTWFYRARQNAGYLDWPQRRSPGWAIGSWIVPIGFLWFPYQIMIDIWRAGLPAGQRKAFAYLPAAWWACWCVAWITARPGTPAAGGHARAAGLVFDSTKLSLAFGAAAAVLLALIVRQVSAGPVGSVWTGFSGPVTARSR